MSGFFIPPTEVRYKRLIDGNSYEELRAQLNESERIVILADSRDNRSGHSMHIAPYIDNQSEFDHWMSEWTENNYYIIHPYAVS